MQVALLTTGLAASACSGLEVISFFAAVCKWVEAELLDIPTEDLVPLAKGLSQCPMTQPESVALIGKEVLQRGDELSYGQAKTLKAAMSRKEVDDLTQKYDGIVKQLAGNSPHQLLDHQSGSSPSWEGSFVACN